MLTTEQLDKLDDTVRELLSATIDHLLASGETEQKYEHASTALAKSWDKYRTTMQSYLSVTPCNEPIPDDEHYSAND